MNSTKLVRVSPIIQPTVIMRLSLIQSFESDRRKPCYIFQIEDTRGIILPSFAVQVMGSGSHIPLGFFRLEALK